MAPPSSGNGRKRTPPAKRAKRGSASIEAQIEAAEAALQAVESELADPGAWSTPEASARSTERHAAAKEAVRVLYEQWETRRGLITPRRRAVRGADYQGQPPTPEVGRPARAPGAGGVRRETSLPVALSDSPRVRVDITPRPGASRIAGEPGEPVSETVRAGTRLEGTCQGSASPSSTTTAG